MNKYNSFLDRYIPRSSVKEGSDKKYRRLRLVLFISMISIAVGPMIVIAILSYQNYINLLQAEEHDQLEWRLDGSIRSFSSMINSVTSIALFAARAGNYTKLTTGDNLDELFFLIKRQYPFVTDVGVINQEGIKTAYSGPYNLIGRDYSKEFWLQETFRKGQDISPVYLGHRQVPHFTIAVSNIDPQTKKQWVLRTNIDAETLQVFVNTIKTAASEDLFLVDDKGILQTNSETFGKALTPYNEDIASGVRSKLSASGDKVFHAIGKIAGTPWSLVLVEKRYLHHEKWVSFRTRLFFILVSCFALSLIVVSFLVNIFKKLLRKSDEFQITMLKEAEHTNKLASIGRLAAGVGHEINNPLAIINQKNGLIEDLLSLSPDFEHKKTITSCCRSVNQSIDRCKAITHRLLSFARRTETVFEDIQINDVLKEVLSFLENSIMHSKIHMELQLAEQLPFIHGDRMHLQQVFLNILNNAIDAIKKNGNISMRSSLVAGDVEIVIQDNGSGIEEEHLAHIFEPFFTTKETGKGTGLGLSITYGLIKEMGGEITVRSHIGKGTAFTITLPASDGKDDE